MVAMTVDLKAALARIEDMIEFLVSDPGAAVLSTSVAAEHAADLRVALTALDRAAEALKPSKAALRIIESGVSLAITDDAGTVIMDDADFQRAATVYATLKPETDDHG